MRSPSCSRLSTTAMTILALVACASSSGSARSSSSPVVSSSASPAAQSPGPGIAIALKGTAMITFRAGSFSRQYRLDSGSNPANSLDLESHQALLDLGMSNSQELRVTVVGGGAPGSTLQGPSQILALFTDSVARVGGIATVGQGICTLALARFGTDGMSGSLDCENLAPLMGATSPVGFTASLDAVPA